MTTPGHLPVRRRRRQLGLGTGVAHPPAPAPQGSATPSSRARHRIVVLEMPAKLLAARRVLIRERVLPFLPGPFLPGRAGSVAVRCWGVFMAEFVRPGLWHKATAGREPGPTPSSGRRLSFGRSCAIHHECATRHCGLGRYRGCDWQSCTWLANHRLGLNRRLVVGHRNTQRAIRSG